MKFKRPILIRNIENPNDYEIELIEIGFKDLMFQDPEEILGLFSSIAIIFFILSFMFGTILGFVYIIKTYF